MTLEFVVDKKTDIKSYLLKNNFSLNIVNGLLKNKNNIFINGKPYVKDYMLDANDKLKVLIEDEKTSVLPVDKEIDVVYEDEYFLVVNKPKNLATIPSHAHFNDSLAGRVVNYFNGKKENIGIHVVNRLDYLTCGLTVFAKSKFIHQLFPKIQVTKKYLCRVKGTFSQPNGVIDQNIARKNKTSIKREVNANGKTAVTEYKVLETDGKSSLLEVNLLTGRTHQIRVHMAYIGHPLIGDTLYNDSKTEREENFFLCAYKISFFMPLNNKEYSFSLDDSLKIF